MSNEFYGRPHAADRPRAGPVDGRGLGDRPPPRRRQRLGGGRAGLRGRRHPRRARHQLLPRQRPRQRASLTGIGPRRRGPAAAAHPAAARHPAPLRARRGRPASTGCGWTSSRTAAWPGCGCGAGRRPPGGRRWDGAGSTRCPTSRRWRCSARSASRRSEAGRLVGAPAGAAGSCRPRWPGCWTARTPDAARANRCGVPRRAARVAPAVRVSPRSRRAPSPAPAGRRPVPRRSGWPPAAPARSPRTTSPTKAEDALEAAGRAPAPRSPAPTTSRPRSAPRPAAPCTAGDDPTEYGVTVTVTSVDGRHRELRRRGRRGTRRRRTGPAAPGAAGCAGWRPRAPTC